MITYPGIRYTEYSSMNDHVSRDPGYGILVDDHVSRDPGYRHFFDGGCGFGGELVL